MSYSLLIFCYCHGSLSPQIIFVHVSVHDQVGGLERGPLSLVRTTEQLLEWKSSGSGLENRGNSLRWPRNTLYLQRLELPSPTSGVRSVGIVRLRTTATEFSFLVPLNVWINIEAGEIVTSLSCSMPLHPNDTREKYEQFIKNCYWNDLRALLECAEIWFGGVPTFRRNLLP
jgi:hypothetical protein